MKLKLPTNLLIIVVLFCISLQNLNAQALSSSIEAETGILTGVTLATQTANSSGSFVTGFDNATDKLTVTINVPVSAAYRITTFYRSPYGDKHQDFYVDGVKESSPNFLTSVTNFVEIDLSKLYLTAGNHSIEIRNSWGYVDLDKFNIYTVPLNVYNITPNLIDPLATVEAKNLYSYLVSQYRTKIISGQTDDYFNNLVNIAGKTPVLRSFDFQRYSQGYSYVYVSPGVYTFGAQPDGTTERAINWYNTTNHKGIVSFHWHWHSPSGGVAGTNTFYSNSTTFDASQAIISGSPQNIAILQDIDAIAVELKKLRDANVPVIWRPLHEAGGAWFWWGAKGSATGKILYDILYDRIVNYHGIHNLIWEWSTPESDWYPGNSKIDMLGYDSYPGDYNYTIQKNIFDQMNTIVGGQKLLAMSENGPIPDIQACLNADAPWSYFMSWNDLVTSQNSNQHIIDTYSNPSVLTIENTLSNETFKNNLISIKCYPNPFINTFNIITLEDRFDYVAYDVLGREIEKGIGTNDFALGNNFSLGMYIIKVKTASIDIRFKIVKKR